MKIYKYHYKLFVVQTCFYWGTVDLNNLVQVQKHLACQKLEQILQNYGTSYFYNQGMSTVFCQCVVVIDNVRSLDKSCRSRIELLSALYI